MEEPVTVLRNWVLKMGRPTRDLPSDAALRNLCSGQGRDIWEYVARHVFLKEKVKNVKGNLDWNRYMEHAANASPEELEKKRLMDLVISLRADIQELDGISDPAQQMADERAVVEVRRRLQDLRQQHVLLKAYSLRAASQRQSLQEHGRKVGERLRGLSEVRSAAQQSVGLLRTKEGLKHSVWHRTGPEPRVLQDLRAACHSRFQYLKSLYDEKSRSPDSCRDGDSNNRSSIYQQWLSQVERAIAAHPPKHILAALESLAAENEEELLELWSKVNVARDLEELRFSYSSSHLQDVSEAPPVLRSVKSLLQEGWRDCELRAVEKVRAARRQMQLKCHLLALDQEFKLLLEERLGHSPELLNANRELFDLQLDLVERQGYCQELVEQGHLINNAIVARNREIQSLQQKHNRILEFQGLVDVKQDLVRALVKGNSSAKSHLMSTQAEIILFRDQDLQQHKNIVRGLTEHLHDSISRELKLFSSVSLPCLDRRLLAGSQRVPAHTLSIHRMESSMNNPQFYQRLMDLLSFPLYKAPEHLIDEAAERKMEREALQMLLGQQREALEAVQQRRANLSVTDTQALVERVRELDERCVRETIPAIHRILEQCQQALNFTHTLNQDINDWWEQPAQFLVPWVKKEGRNVQDWLQRWSQLVQRSQDYCRELERQRPPAAQDPRQGRL
ncbi:HAUS augmin-like complex subunit 5 [Mobula birostris]|uniref:HAUS augmin-like complex subunit 5 n=1 Tax=Mobula birostris TaxID=1983395 RepID=UPI003B289664